MIAKTGKSSSKAPTASTAVTANSTRALLNCGTFAGPLFIAVVLIQMLTGLGLTSDVTRSARLASGARDGSRSPTSLRPVCYRSRLRSVSGECCVLAGRGLGDCSCSARSEWG
jgi:hypothetical protein